jgi:hypothetical protein
MTTSTSLLTGSLHPRHRRSPASLNTRFLELTLISLTCVPPLPIIILASCVTIKHLIAICWGTSDAAWTGAEGTDEGGLIFEVEFEVADVGGLVVDGPASALLQVSVLCSLSPYDEGLQKRMSSKGTRKRGRGRKEGREGRRD